MWSFLRCVLCCDDELNTGRSNFESYCNGSPSRSYNYRVISDIYGTFSRTIFPDPIVSTQTGTRTQSRNYSTSFNFPQKSNTPSVYNRPNHTLPRIYVKVDSRVDPKKAPDISTATHTNVFPKSTSSSSDFPSPPSPKLGSSFALSSSLSPFGAFPDSSKSPLVSTKPVLASAVSLLTANQTMSQYNVVEKDLTRLHEFLEDVKGLIRQDIVPGVFKEASSPQTHKDYFTALLEDCYLEVPAKRSLADYLRESGPRLVSLYGSTELYPTDDARCIIQGIVTAILNLKKDQRKHNYLRNPENLILEDKRCHPYSNYVRDLATGHVLRNRKILEQAEEDYPTSIEVTLEKNRMDLESDDLAALKYLIFDVILVLDDDKKPRLPAEWESFKKLFTDAKLDYAVLSSHPCLWGYTKRLGFYFALDRWCNPCKSEKGVRDIVDDNLSSMRIFRTNWVRKIKRDRHLRKFTRKMTPSRQREVYGLIRFFRNLVEHCPDIASESSPYRKERYLDYKLRKIYPNLLEEIHQKLLHAGFIY